MDTPTGVGQPKRNAQFLPMIIGIAAVVVILAGVHGASDLISQFLMAFVITVAVAPSRTGSSAVGWARRGPS